MLYADEGQILIDPQNLGPEDEKVVLNADKTQVTIMPNATTLELKNKQLDEKFNFMFNVVLDSVTYGGTVNLGCHVSKYKYNVKNQHHRGERNIQYLFHLH